MSASIVSATTVTYFSELELLRTLLNSLEVASKQLYQKTGYSVHYYLVDNSEDEEYFKGLGRLCAQFGGTDSLQLSIIRAHLNLGYSGGNNLVLDQLASAYHLIINPDVVIQPDAFCCALDYLDEDKNVVMLSPKVIDHGRSSHVAKVYPDCLTLALRYLSLPSLNHYFSERLSRYECDHLSDTADNSIELAGGCFIVIRTEAFKQLRGFDDWFFMYFEDYDLSLRARKLGDIAYVPAVKITHAGGGVGRKNIRHHFYFAVSAIKFFSRYGWRFW